jgi:4-amino-4-deoxy-L-arabinose transferase-like glycosyltransferase
VIDTRPKVAWVPVLSVGAAIVALLLITAGGYGYHRDELYFRFLGQHPAWGYIDQPPLTPLLTHLDIVIFGDNLYAIRVSTALAIGVGAVLAALIAREIGGGPLAQTLAALGLASAFPFVGGHVEATATYDVPIWLLVILFTMRALLRERPKYWLAVGLVAGLGLYNKHLVILLLLMIGVGLLLVGPRRVLLSPWLWAGMALAVVVGLPNLIYQVANDFPQLQMAHAIAKYKGDDSRTQLIPLQLAMIGFAYTPIWIAGIVKLFRDRALRPIRGFAVAYLTMIVVVFVVAGQPYYTLGLLLALYAIGCVSTARWLARARWRAGLIGAAVVVTVVSSAVLALPILPVRTAAEYHIPDIIQPVQDEIGWPEYVRQIAQVYNALPPADQARAVIVTGNYGEHGAVARFGPLYGLPAVYSGHNQLYYEGRPPESATVVVLVVEHASPAVLAERFASCQANGRLNNGVGVDNEEQGLTLYVCRNPRQSWAALWPQFKRIS